MNDCEKALLFFDDYFKGKLNYAIHASSLLHIIRSGRLVITDAEVDLICYGNDLTPQMINQIKTCPLFRSISESCEKYGEIYFKDVSNSYVALSPLWNKNGHVYLNMSKEHCVNWPIKEFYNKWSTIKYLDREFKVPGEPEKYLEMWYGKDWRTPKNCTWGNNKNRTTYDKLTRPGNTISKSGA